MMIAVALALLAITDCVMCGFRAASGREGRLDKSALYRQAALRGLVGGLVVTVVSAMLVAALVMTASDPHLAWALFSAAGRVCVIVYAVYAAAIFAAFAFYFAPVGDFRVLTNVIVFGPFTLARPWVIASGLVAAVVSTRDVRVGIAATSAGLAMLGFQRVMDRPFAKHWRRLLEPTT